MSSSGRLSGGASSPRGGTEACEFRRLCVRARGLGLLGAGRGLMLMLLFGLLRAEDLGLATRELSAGFFNGRAAIGFKEAQGAGRYAVSRHSWVCHKRSKGRLGGGEGLNGPQTSSSCGIGEQQDWACSRAC
eukprot:2038441-Rhodomonas_salina.2